MWPVYARFRQLATCVRENYFPQTKNYFFKNAT
jgi:hypothetical protein